MEAVNTRWQTTTAVSPPPSLWRMAVTLFKLRIVSLLLLSSFGGAALGMRQVDGRTVWSWLLLTVTGILSAAGASAINQYWDRDRDLSMKRTASRPIPTGQIARPRLVLWLGVGMVLAATGLAAIFNRPLAFWIFAGAAIYVGVYTVWLKPRTPLNIVIGGAAGSCAVISGGAAVGSWTAVSVWLLAALVFAWTPVHFWALALAYRDDYAEANFPMLPAIVQPIVAARWTALHTVLTAVLGIAIGLIPQLDGFYFLLVLPGTAVLIKKTISLLREPERPHALALFHASNLFLTWVLVLAIITGLWR